MKARHRWLWRQATDLATCEACGLRQRAVRRVSRRRRDHGAVVCYRELSTNGGATWTALPRGHALPRCTPRREVP